MDYHLDICANALYCVFNEYVILKTLELSNNLTYHGRELHLFAMTEKESSIAKKTIHTYNGRTLEEYRSMVTGFDLMQLKQLMTLMLPYTHALNKKPKGKLGMTSSFMILTETIRILEEDLHLISSNKSLKDFFDLSPKYNKLLKENEELIQQLEEQTLKINDFKRSFN